MKNASRLRIAAIALAVANIGFVSTLPAEAALTPAAALHPSQKVAQPATVHGVAQAGQSMNVWVVAARVVTPSGSIKTVRRP